MNSDNSEKSKRILWILFLIPVFIIGIVIAGRKMATPSNEKIIENLQNTRNYSCCVEYTFVNSKDEYKENTMQYYSANNGMRIEFQDEGGRVKVYKGSEIRMQEENGENYTVDKNIDEIYPLAFIENILDKSICKEIEVINPEWSDKEYIKINIDYPNKNKHLDKAEFYVDKKEKCPVLLKILDDTGKERILISYKDFKVNKQSDESLF